MAKYRVTTDNGVYEVTTDDSETGSAPQASQQYYGDTTMSAQPGGLAQWARNAADDIRHGGNQTWVGDVAQRLGLTPTDYGVSHRASEMMAGTPLGIAKMVQGAGEIPSQPLQGLKHIATGAAQATGPLGFAFSGADAPMVAAPKVAGAALEAVPTAAKMLIPTLEHAGGVIDDVVNTAGPTAVSMRGVAPILKRINDLKDAGTDFPAVAKALINRVQKGSPISLQEARDFASNASGASQSEASNFSGPMASQVRKLAKELHSAIGEAADTVQDGLGRKYLDAVDEYRRAISLQEKAAKAKDWAIKAAITGAGLGAGGVTAYKILHE